MRKTLMLLAIGLAACGDSVGVNAKSDGDAEAAMMAADRAFNDQAQVDGLAAAFAAFAAADALMMRPGQWEPVRGPQAIAATFSDTPPEDKLTWEPMAAFAGASGDLGYTWGRWIYHSTDDTGAPKESHGKYVTIWRKQADGSWKYVLDTGTNNPPPPQNE